MATPITLQIPPLPAGFCLSATSVHDLLTQIQAFLPGEFTVWNVGPNQPTVENRTTPWHKTDPTTGIGVGDFDYSAVFGLWLKNHWINNGGSPPFNERRLFIGSLIDLETFEGGEPGTISDVTGPFWVQDTTFNNLIPVGVGAFIATPNTVIVSPRIPSAGSVANDPGAIGVFFIKPSSRIYDRG